MTTVTTTDATLLQLMWLASPALPVGAFSYSEGLETAVEEGRVTDETQAATWLTDQLLLAQARSDLAATAQAHAAWTAHDIDRLAALNTWVLGTRESAEFRLQTEQAGRSLCDWLRQRAADDGAHEDARIATLRALAPAPSWPLAYALAAWRTGADARAALLAMAFGWAENMVQAAVKAVPLGQSAGQRLLGALAARIPDAVDDALARDDSTRQAFTPMLAIVSARHEAQYSRLFRS
ncbi:urease accessory protein UreF [Rubrivivax albus]|uniref:Urease accessory protein UreF n=1 Tax=Rubrivivax albus TaxID=2499835 RepID=A0A3S2U6Q8_9BURK|nr:urease accessory UreF family protein [Rubrivivax albus]RVT49398.1 urease accessory protein UreF [Rubrivivax albus]